MPTISKKNARAQAAKDSNCQVIYLTQEMIDMGASSKKRRVSEKAGRVDIQLRKQMGTLLRGLREKQGMTQNDLAQAVDQTYFTFISQVENGGSKIPSHDIEVWAKALDVDSRVLAKECLRHYDPYTFEALFPGESLDASEL